DIPEPLSPASQFSSTEPLLIESAAYRHLVEDLRRYCNREVNGRSFLIAGHRGAGKTTLVASAFAKLLADFDRRPLRARPVFVPVLGPSLLPDPADTAVDDLRRED